MQTAAIVMKEPGQVALDVLDILDPGTHDAVIDIEWSGISSGTERLLWQGRMPHFPGMGYPLVPGYESVGRVAVAGPASGLTEGQRVFVPGATCFTSARALFGASARRLVIPGSRAVPNGTLDGPQATQLALAATAVHVAPQGSPSRPDLIIGHGVLGRLLARLTMLDGGPPPVVWEQSPRRMSGATGYRVLDPAEDPRRDYRCICDMSGDPAILDTVIQRLAPGGEIILAGFYSAPLSFAFAPAFMREMRLRIAAQFLPADLTPARDLGASGTLNLDGLITHQQPATASNEAYRTAFDDPSCLKMALDWRQIS